MAGPAAVAGFALFMGAFLLIGLAAMRKSRSTSADYLLAGRDVAPWLTGLSAVATNNSGYMFIGMIGYTYMVGLPSIWLMIGWIVGDLTASLLIYKPLRKAAEETDVHSFGGLVAHWGGADRVMLRRVAGAVSLFFLGAYASAQLAAGGKALQVLFGWEHWAGAVLGGLVVLAYSFAGGLRASIWTDAAQSFVMVAAMGMLLWFGLDAAGGADALAAKLAAVSPAYMDLLPRSLEHGGFLAAAGFIGGWLAGGFGVAGQPHIVIRFMALDDPENMNRVRFWYYGWFTVFYALTIGVGLTARVLLPETAGFDAELALPTLALELLPGVFVGMVLAGIFAATMSTADSLLLSCGAALTRDFSHRFAASFWTAKIGTLLVTAFALAIALSGNKSVFALVLDAWAVLAAAFAPLLTLYALGRIPGEKTGIVMVLAGVVGVYFSQWAFPGGVYAIVPGMGAGFAVFGVEKVVEKLRRRG